MIFKTKYNISYILLLLIALSISLQFDYIFFNISFFVPFVTVVGIFIITSILPNKSIMQVIIFLFFCCILLLSTLFLSIHSFLELKRQILYLGYIIITIFTVNKLLYKISFDEIKKIIRLTIYLSVIAVLIETFFRFNFPTMDLRADNSDNIIKIISMQSNFLDLIFEKYFYAYKFSSIMFYDSNFVGLFLLPLLVLNLFYINLEKNQKIFKFLVFIILILIFLSFSRSAIITSMVIIYFYFMYIIYYKNKHLFLIILLISLLVGSVGLIYFINFLFKDGSFLTKIGVFSSLQTILDHDIINILFGYGVEAGGTIYSYEEGAYTHVLIPLLLGQIGIIGLTFYLSFFTYYSIKIGFFGSLLFFSIMLSGLSLADPWQIMNYFTFMIMSRLSYLKRINL